MYLILSLLALGFGPALGILGRRRPVFGASLDNFLVITLAAILLFGVLPEAVNQAGAAAAGLFLVGLLLPSLLERYVDSRAHGTHRVILALAFAAIVAHAVLDGAALAVDTVLIGGTGHLTIAVILHRLLEGLVIWLLIRPAFGTAASLGALGICAVATVGGFTLAGEVAGTLSSPVLGLTQAALAGALFHAAVHPVSFNGPEPEEAPVGRAWVLRLGMVAGVVFAGVLIYSEYVTHGAGADLYLSRLARLALMAAPVLALIYLAAPFAAVARRADRTVPVGVAYGQTLENLLVRSLPYLLAILLIAAVPRSGAGAAGAGDRLFEAVVLVWFVVATLIALFRHGARGFFARLLPGGLRPHSH